MPRVQRVPRHALRTAQGRTGAAWRGRPQFRRQSRRAACCGHPRAGCEEQAAACHPGRCASSCATRLPAGSCALTLAAHIQPGSRSRAPPEPRRPAATAQAGDAGDGLPPRPRLLPSTPPPPGTPASPQPAQPSRSRTLWPAPGVACPCASPCVLVLVPLQCSMTQRHYRRGGGPARWRGWHTADTLLHPAHRASAPSERCAGGCPVAAERVCEAAPQA